MGNILLNKHINEIFEAFKDEKSQPKGELEYKNSYTLLVAVVLSAQATDISVNKATRNLFKIVTTPQDMVLLGQQKLESYVRSIGLYRTKSANIIKLSNLLIDRYGSEVPNNFADLVMLPGVGRKTANVVLNIAFGVPTIAVDTHVFRVSKRLGLAKGKTPEQVEKELLKVIPSQYLLHAHHWLILHGRYICKSRKPQCAICFLSSYCHFKESFSE